MLRGIDISNHQGKPDFQKVKDDGWDFVVVKAVEGVGYRDPQLTRNQEECRKLGITLGYYAFVRPDLGNFPEDEANYFLTQIGTLKPGELLFLDFEVNFGDKVTWCKRWLDFVYHATGVKAPIYLNKSLESNNDWSPVISGDYGLWLADYTYNPDSPLPPTQWPVMAFRQYSNAEKVDGINGNVDGNVFYGDEEALKAYGYKSESGDQDEECSELVKKLERKLADTKHKLEAKSTEITSLEGKLNAATSSLKICTTNHQIALGALNAKQKEHKEYVADSRQEILDLEIALDKCKAGVVDCSKYQMEISKLNDTIRALKKKQIKEFTKWELLKGLFGWG